MMKSYISISLLLTMLLLVFTGTAMAQTQEVEELVTNAVELRGEEEEDVSMPDEILNDLEAEMDAPSFKTDEEGERAAARFINFDNRTPWYIQCFVDGVYQGLVAPYGDLTIYLPSNRTYRFYARADFDDNTRKHWGGVNRYVSGGLNWQLHR